MSKVWYPIEEAPKDGRPIHGKLGRRRLVTWWGKACHVPLYGWCHGKVENTDLWEPTHWRPYELGR
jgi:hypothetical protein